MKKITLLFIIVLIPFTAAARTVTLSPGQSSQFATKKGEMVVLSFINESRANQASVAFASQAGNGHFIMPPMGRHIIGPRDYKGAVILTVNTTNPNNPSTVSVSVTPRK